MKRFMILIFTLLSSVNTYSMQAADSQLNIHDHTSCTRVMMQVERNGTTFYEHLHLDSPAIATRYGNLYICQRPGTARIPQGLQFPVYILCKDTQQYLMVPHQRIIIPINDNPIEDVPHSEQAPQG